MYRQFEKPFTLDSVVRLVISLLITALGLYTLYILRGVLLPFMVAWLIAYILNPTVRFFQNKLFLKNRILSVVATLLSVAGILTIIIILLIPLIEKEYHQINDLISSYHMDSIGFIDGIPVEVQNYIINNIDFNTIKDILNKENATESINQYIVPALTGVVSSTISIILGIAWVFIVFLYLIFILIDYDKINELWRNLIPMKHRPSVEKIVIDIENSMNKYFRHQFLICIILSVLYAIGFQLIGLPLAIMLGILVGLLHMIPYLQVISFIPAVLLCWLKVSQTDQNFWPIVGLVALVYLVVQLIMDLFLVPRIMGKAMGLNPAIILLSLSVWGYLLGFVGMIIAIPLTTLLLSYYQSFINSISDEDAEKFAIIEDKKVEQDQIE